MIADVARVISFVIEGGKYGVATVKLKSIPNVKINFISTVHDYLEIQFSSHGFLWIWFSSYCSFIVEPPQGKAYMIVQKY